ncbi:hypothetical protein [Paludisphaera rhizosphaerae]|uniref:hypothetical protein n=1 Tax=Paludisphaera rhizosphaerae TaxID=2711216 RepID=UPI0013EBD7FA|nr:hypothetical protein [Paludisphaera rhizosphaerae]
MPTSKYNFKLSPDVTIQVEADNQADAFKQYAAAHEIFGQHGTCRGCGADAFPRVRVVGDHSYSEMFCSNPECGRVIAFGQKKKPSGALYPKRKDKDGKWLEHGGWVRWAGKPRDDEGDDVDDDDDEVVRHRRGR